MDTDEMKLITGITFTKGKRLDLQVHLYKIHYKENIINESKQNIYVQKHNDYTKVLFSNMLYGLKNPCMK